MLSGHPLHILGSQPAPSLVAISPPVLFFFLGVVAAMVRSNIAIPKAATKLLSLYLLWAIGFKGGVELVASGFSADAIKTILLATGISLIVPLWAYAALRHLISRANAAAMAACYGSVSVVTFCRSPHLKSRLNSSKSDIKTFQRFSNPQSAERLELRWQSEKIRRSRRAFRHSIEYHFRILVYDGPKFMWVNWIYFDHQQA